MHDTVRWMRRLVGALALLVGSVLLVRQFGRLGWGEVGATVLRVPLLVLAAALALTGARFLLWTLRWRGMLHMRPRPGYGQSLVFLLAGVFVGHLVPYGRLVGGLARARLAARSLGTRTAGVYGTVLMDQTLNTVVGVLAVAAGLALTVGSGLDTSRMPGGPVAWGLLAGVAMLSLLALPRLRDRREAALTEEASPWRRARRGFAEALPGPVDGVAGLGISVLMLGLTLAAELVVLGALGAGLPVTAALAATALGGLLGTTSGSPGGLGVSEATQIEVYTGLGVPGGAAAAAVLVGRGTHLLWVLAGGSACLATLGGFAAVRSRTGHRRPEGAAAGEDPPRRVVNRRR